MKFRQRPFYIEAVHWDCNEKSQQALREMGCSFILNADNTIVVDTAMTGTVVAQPLDWIIKSGLYGFYPCGPDLFFKIYEPADGTPYGMNAGDEEGK